MTVGIRFDCQLERWGFRLDASVSAGSSLGLFGPSGAGKSTLLKALAGLVPTDSLVLSLDGETLVDTGSGGDPPPHRRRIGLVFQEHRLFPHLSVKENLRYGARSVAAARWKEVVDILGLGPLLDRLPQQCSGGECARVALGRALLASPRLLLLDEPFAALDRGLRLQLLPFLQRVVSEANVPLIFVSHDLGDLLAMTDSLALMENGRIVGEGALADLVRTPGHLDLLHDCGLLFNVPGIVESRDASGLTHIAHGGSSPARILCGDPGPWPIGARVDVRLRPEDVILALPTTGGVSSLAAQLSLSNQLPGRVTHLTDGAARTLVSLDCDLGVPVLAEVTQRSVQRLGLAPGVQVIAMMKAQALRLAPRVGAGRVE